MNEIIKFNKDLSFYESLIHGFFEKLINLSNPKSNGIYWDQYRFITWELYLYMIALLINKRIINSYKVFVEKKYIIIGQHNTELHGFGIIFDEIVSLKNERKKRLNLNRKSLAVDELNKRKNNIVSFESLMQADLILYILSLKNTGSFGYWFPSTLIYSSGYGTNFEFFIRAEEESEFQLLLDFIGHSSKEEIIESSDHHALSRSSYFGGFFSFGELMNFQKLGTKL